MNEPGTFIWNELVTPDQHIAGPFYSGLFGWDRREVDAGPLGTYTLFRRHGQDVAGIDESDCPRLCRLTATTVDRIHRGG